MANTFAPNGLQPVRRLDGAAWSDQVSTFLIAAANTSKFFRGDLVVVLSTGYIDATASITTGIALGVFWGCEVVPGTSGSPWQPNYAGVAQTIDTRAFVIADPNVVYRAQVGTGATPGLAGGPAVQGDVFKTISFRNGAGNASSGISGGYVDYAGLSNSSAALPLTIIGLVGQTSATGPVLQGPPVGVNGTDVTTAANLVEVIFNASAFKAGVAGI